MTPNQINCIQRSFQTVEAISRPFSRCFYLRLFQLSPDLKQHFNSQADYKGRKLVALLGTAVRSLHNIDGLRVVVTTLGRRYIDRGLNELHFSHISQALIETLAMSLGDEFTDDVAAAWTALSSLLIDTVKKSTSQNSLARCPWGKEIPMALAVTR